MSTTKKNAGTPGIITSPEELNDYVRTSHLSVWLFLAAVIVLLAAFFVWAFLGRLDTTYLCPAATDGSHLLCYVDESHEAALESLQSVTVDGREYPVVSVSKRPVQAGILSPYVLHVSGLSADDWVYVVTAEADLPDGIYSAVFYGDSVKPISFLVG